MSAVDYINECWNLYIGDIINMFAKDNNIVT